MQRVIVDSQQIQGDRLHLRADQEHYLFRVLRLQPGQQFLALDGQGLGWVTTLGAPGLPAGLGSPLEDPAPGWRSITLAMA